MSRLTRYSPFSTEPFADAFEGLLRPMRGLADEAARMDMDIIDNDSEYVLHVEIPGVDKNDIQVDLDGDQVRIAARKRAGNEQVKDGQAVRRERYWGEMHRVVSLAGLVDASKATATYENGVLTLKLPKQAGESQHRIAIS